MDLEKLKKQRTALRGATTKLINKIEHSLRNDTDVVNLEILTSQLTDKFDSLKEVNREILNLLSLDEVAIDTENSDSLQEKLIAYKCQLLKRIKDLNFAHSSSSNENAAASLTNRQIQNSGSASCTIKLPKLTLEKFYGDPKRWTEFWNSFECTIDKNVSLSKIEKFAYLKSFLSGQAHNMVSGFELTNENYDNCLKSLKDRYGRKDVIVSCFMNKILNLEAVRNPANLRALRKLYDELEISIRNLEAMEVTAGSYGHLLTPILLKLIPEDMVLDFNRKKNSGSEINVLDLINFIKREIECREASKLIMNDGKDFHPQRFDRMKSESRGYSRTKNIPTVAAFNAQVNQMCIFCSKSHDSSKCGSNTPTEKLNKLKLENRCFNCFKKYHLSRNCRIREACIRCGSKNHHESVCTSNFNRPNASTRNFEQNSPKNETVLRDSKEDQHRNSEAANSVSQLHNNVSGSKQVLLQTCTVLACTKSKSKMTRLILDQGSHRSFIHEKLAKDLDLKPVRTENLSVFSFGIKTPIAKTYPVVILELKNRNNQNKIKIEALVTDTISSSPIRAPGQHVHERMTQMGLKIADPPVCRGNVKPVEFLVGADRFWDIVSSERVNIDKELCAINSRFGWLVAGMELSKEKGEHCSQNAAVLKAVIRNDLRDFWELESMGINLENDKYSDGEIDIINRFENELQFKNGRYESKLIWKDSSEVLANNFDVAKGRFDVLNNKLRRNQEIYREYNEIVDDQLNEGIVEECTTEIVESGYYMPHRAVIRSENETTRVRIVFDASSKAENAKSLNDCLESGPNLNPNVLDVILKFRLHQIAFSADIEKAFLMIGISEEDRNYLKFLWFPDKDKPFKIMRMKRVPFGVTMSPFILAATIKYHIKKYENTNRDVYQMLDTSLYVDDLYYGADKLEDAYRLSSDAVNVFREAGMNLRKLQSNCKELNALWMRSEFKENADLAYEAKCLGLIWNPVEDFMKLNLKSLKESIENVRCSKRHILKSVARIYDPVGFISPFVVRIKLLLQEIWQRGIDWDGDLPNEIKDEWEKWCLEIPDVENFELNRKYFSNCEKSDVTLHIFSDASPKAYGAVAYFRYINSDQRFDTSFLMSKCRVAPLKSLTLPRLELMGAVIAARLAKYLTELFSNISHSVHLWTDSEIVLHWIKGSPKEWKPFVSNRVAEIQSLSDPQTWRHCEGVNNPADLLSRGSSAQELLGNRKWWKGPDWLSESEETWSMQKIITMNKQRHPEYRHRVIVNTHVVENIRKVMDIENYSNFLKLLRITAWIKRFISKCKKMPTEDGPLTADELGMAEEFWIKSAQEEFYASEIHSFKNKKPISAKSSLFSLAPFLDKGILRIQGRLEESECTMDEKHPIILPKNSKFTELLVQYEHNKILHGGVAATLTRIRKKYWIPKARQLVKRIIGKCLICSKYALRPANQMTAQIPKDRISTTPPFSISGVDFTGPVFVRVGKEVEKSYIALFTCAVTRAVHLELVSDMSTKKFLLAFRRFVSRRGSCRIIYSDNAKTFKSASKELKHFLQIVREPEVQDFISAEGITWKFIVERAPWWGGFYERLMRSIKEPLKKILGGALLTFEELMTVLTEVETVVNQRPLTYVSNDVCEPEPLTPAHFLHFTTGRLEYPCNFAELFDKASSKESLLKRKQYQTKLLKQLWIKWKEQYLLNLRNAHHFGTPEARANLKVNEVVLVEGTTKSKFLWDLGLITEVILGRDGLARSCVVKTKRGLFKRPIQLIYPLELSD